MVTSSTGAQGTIRRTAKFDWSVNFIPYHDDVKGAPQNSIIGGASLWVMAKKPAADYKGVAKFFSFLSSPEIQMFWHTSTGYVPITHGGVRDDAGSPASTTRTRAPSVAVKQLTNKPPTANSKGLRFGNYVQGREVIEEEMEAVFARQEGRQDGAGRRGAARQRHPAQVRGRRTSNSKQPRGKAGRLPVCVAAVRAGGAADRDHDRVSSSGRRCRPVWYSFQLQDAFGERTQFVGLAQLRRAVPRRELPRTRSRSRRSSACWSPAAASPFRCCSRRWPTA